MFKATVDDKGDHFTIEISLDGDDVEEIMYKGSLEDCHEDVIMDAITAIYKAYIA